MGADIHIYAERKLKDGTWAMCKTYESQKGTVFDDPRLEPDAYGRLFYRARSRNYSFFAALAGVRGDGPAHKGFPGDASPLVREEFDGWGADSHSPSFYSAREFVPIFVEHWLTEAERSELVADKLDDSSYPLVAQVLEHYLGLSVPYDDNNQPDVDRLRFVFWFDN